MSDRFWDVLYEHYKYRRILNRIRFNTAHGIKRASTTVTTIWRTLVEKTVNHFCIKVEDNMFREAGKVVGISLLLFFYGIAMALMFLSYMIICVVEKLVYGYVRTEIKTEGKWVDLRKKQDEKEAVEDTIIPAEVAPVRAEQPSTGCDRANASASTSDSAGCSERERLDKWFDQVHGRAEGEIHSSSEVPVHDQEGDESRRYGKIDGS